MCALTGEEANTRQSNWSFTCMPSWPEIPTPTSATWIMLTSFAPSPKNNAGSKNHWFLRCRDSHGHIEPLGSLMGWVLWERSGKGQKRKLRWPIGIRHSTTWNCQPYQAVPEINCHRATIFFSGVCTIRIRIETAFNVDGTFIFIAIVVTQPLQLGLRTSPIHSHLSNFLTESNMFCSVQHLSTLITSGNKPICDFWVFEA